MLDCYCVHTNELNQSMLLQPFYMRQSDVLFVSKNKVVAGEL